MARFRYSLQTALDRALGDERRARGALLRAAALARAERRTLVALEAQLPVRASHASAGERVALGLAVAAHVAALGALCRAGRSRESGAARHVADAAAACERATRRATALGRHRARRYEEFAASCARREASELDESNARSRQAGHNATENNGV